MAEQHDRILGYFLEEADEHLISIEQGLLRLPQTITEPETISELFRGAHSIAGSAAMLELFAAQQIGKHLEANFKILKEHPTILVDDRLQQLMLKSFGFLRSAIDDLKIAPNPYYRDPASPDPIGDSVFEQLNSHLQYLLITPSTKTVDYDEETFFSPEFNSLDEETFFTDIDLDDHIPSILANRDIAQQLVAGVNQSSHFEDIADLYSNSSHSFFNPFESIELSHDLTTHSQGDEVLTSTPVDIDILPTINTIQDFADLDLTDSILLEQSFSNELEHFELEPTIPIRTFPSIRRLDGIVHRFLTLLRRLKSTDCDTIEFFV